MVVTNNPELADRARLLREYGWAERDVSGIPGWNSRLDEVQAAVLRIKLPHLEADNEARPKIASLYDQALAGHPIVSPKLRAQGSHVYHLYVVRSSERDELNSFLRGRGIGTLVHYPVPVHQQPAYRRRFRGADGLQETERAASEVLSLPIYPELPPDELNQVISLIEAYFEMRTS